MKIKEIRDELYRYHDKYYPELLYKWKWWSYRKIKLKLYFEWSLPLTYLFLKANITPNTVTTIFTFTGILAGILLATPFILAILIGIIILFFRSILDECDGSLARIKKQRSITGTILDPYGSLVGWIALWVGFGLYVANKSGSIFFYSLSPIIPAIFAADIFSFAKHWTELKYELYKRYCKNGQECNKDSPLSNELSTENKNNEADTVYLSRFRKIRDIAKFVDTEILGSGARTVDSICLVILIELLLPKVFISKFVYLFFLAWQIMLFCGKFYTVASGKWEIMNFGRSSDGSVPDLFRKEIK